MSRNKENIPLTTGQRQDGYYLSSSKQLASDEFFTDSLLDATRLSSRIPSPSPQKPTLTKARRARITRTTRNAPGPLHRSATFDDVIAQSRKKSPQPTTPLRNGTGSTRKRTYSLTDTPNSRDELPPPSPYSGITSPPSKDLADTYQRIEDEEDLAQTEREISSDESNPSDVDFFDQKHYQQRSHSESPLKSPLNFHIPSSASTPTRSAGSLHRENKLAGLTQTLSEASGLSFLKNMTDQDLAAKLTPHVSESARNRARLAGNLGYQKPIAFSKAQVPSRFDPKGVSSIPVPQVTAFSKALKPPPNPLLYNNPGDDPAHDRPPSQQSGPESLQSSNDARHNRERAQRSLPINPKADRNFNFTTNHGFPPQRPALTEKNLEQQNRGSPNMAHSLQPQSSIPSLPSDQPLNSIKVVSEGVRVTNGHVTRLPQLRRSIQAENKVNTSEQSQIDWAAAAADMPLPSVENSVESEIADLTKSTASNIPSPEKSRRWENDFTGQSFQVSESPPVRYSQVLQERTREQEIDGVAKQAVTTNRLSQIREQHSQESLRSASRSPGPRSTPRSANAKPYPVAAEQDESEVIAERIPDTPVVIYRSSSNSASEKSSTPISMERPGVDRSKSHDHLQRLARAMSSTPKSSPPSESESRPPLELEESTDKQQAVPENKEEQLNAGASDSNGSVPVVVAQTPRIVGAWTDTILPDTVRTERRPQKNGYVQTPHVSAGGWVDTPAPVELRKYSGTIPTIVEVPEELTAGIAKDTSSNDTVKIKSSSDTRAVILVQAEGVKSEQPKSALASILDKQKSRLVSQDITTASREDTLNLGNDTIESLQDLLDIDEDELTTLSRLSAADDDTKPLGEVQAEAELLERLGVKLDRLRTNLHDARKGISRLEHQVSNPQETGLTTKTIVPQLGNATLLSDPQHKYLYPETAQSKHFPHASLNLSVPIPLLFHPRSPTQWLPRPTLVGSLVLTLWTWYVVENFMCELYCRPTHTDFYIWPSEPEPEFPFVLPTMLGRWTRVNNLAISSTFVWMFGFLTGTARAIYRIFAMALGLSDGFVDDGSDEATNRVVKKVLETATSVVLPSVAQASGIDLSMNDDEYM